MNINDYIVILVVILELFLGISLLTDEDREEKIGAKKIIDSMIGLLFITVPVMVLIEIFII